MLLALAVILPWMTGALSGARADVRAVLVCRQLPPGPKRADCLERASADLEREAASPVRHGEVLDGEGRAHPARPNRLTAGVAAITYQDGRPIFRLNNGQTWHATDRRRLTFKPGRSYVTIEKTPVGMLLHYNGSFFALQVVRTDG